jgi:hypothetical protein
MYNQQQHKEDVMDNVQRLNQPIVDVKGIPWTKFRLISVPITLLKPIGINPPVRTTQKEIRGLSKRLDSSKCQVPLVTIFDEKDNMYWVIDGGRRLEACRIIDKGYVDILVIDKYHGTKEDLFVMLNRDVLKFNQKQQLYLMRHEGVFFTKRLKDKYDYLMNVGGIELIDLMIERQQSVPNVRNYTDKASKYCKKFLIEDIKTIVYWLVDNKQTYPIRRAMEARISPELLWSTIKKNRRLQDTIFKK